MRPSSHRAPSLTQWVKQPHIAETSQSMSGTSAAGFVSPRADSSSAKAFQTDQVFQVTGLRYWLVFLPIAWLLKLYYSTLRWEMDAEDAKALKDQSRPILFVIWHNRSLLVPAIYQRFRCPERFTCLISPSKAAAWEARFFESYGIHCARGSSSRRSIQATREMLQAHRNGNDIGISPDGPSGPLYQMKRGAVMMARKTQSPLLMMGAESRAAIRLKTWDRHFIPLPFAKIRIRARMVESAEIFGADNDADDSEAAARLSQRLMELTRDNF